MTLDSATTSVDNSPERVTPQFAQRLTAENRTDTRKHFIDAYAEHLSALRNGRSAE